MPFDEDNDGECPGCGYYYKCVCDTHEKDPLEIELAHELVDDLARVEDWLRWADSEEAARLASLSTPDALTLLQEAKGSITASLVWMMTNYVSLDSSAKITAAEILDLAHSLVDLVDAKRVKDGSPCAKRGYRKMGSFLYANSRTTTKVTIPHGPEMAMSTPGPNKGFFNPAPIV